MDAKSLDSLSIEQLDALLARAQVRRAALWQRQQDDAQQRADAILAAAEAQARQVLESVGLSLQRAKHGVTRKRGKSSSVYHAGRVYQHPDDATIRFKAGGSYPKWVKALHAADRRAQEVPDAAAGERAGAPRHAAQ